MKNNKDKTVLQKIGSILFYVVIVLLLIVVGISLYSKFTKKQILNYNVLWVLSNSMEPTISTSSYILVEKVDVKDIKKGDIISFYSNDPSIKGSLNTHRVIDIIGDNEEFITKGDNNYTQDEYVVKAEEVVYKYVGKLHVLTFFGRLFATKYGIIAILILFLVLVMIIVASMKKENEKDTREKEIERRVKEEVERLEREGLDSKDIK